MFFLYRASFLPAQTYLKLLNVDKETAESQNLGMILLCIANLSPQLFSSDMLGLVSASKRKSDNSTGHIPFFMTEAEKVIQIYKGVMENTSSMSTLFEKNYKFVFQCTWCLKTAVSRHNSAVSDSELSIYISLTEAVVASEKIGINVEEIQKLKAQNGKQLTKILMTHTNLAPRSCHQNSNENFYS